MNATQAVRQRDRNALEAAFPSLEEAEQFKTQILPWLSPDDCRWFWQTVAGPKMLEVMMSHVRDACLSIADEMELLPNVHYSLGNLQGYPTMVCSEQVSKVFYASLPPERHSVLRFYLQITN